MEDEFGVVSAKLGALLGVGSGVSVLMAGPQAGAWYRDFQRAYRATLTSKVFDVPEDESVGGQLGLVIWDATAERTMLGMSRALRQAKNALAPEGMLLLVARNRWDPRAFLNRWRRREPRGLALGLSGYVRLLRAAGFNSVHTFLPMPSGRPEEFVKTGRQGFNLPDDVHWILRLANRLGIYHQFHQTFLLLALPADHDPLTVLSSWVVSALSGKHVSVDSLELQRFDLRRRGALLLFFQSPDGVRIVARVAVSNAIDRRVKRNAGQVRLLRENPVAESSVLERLPAQYGGYKWKGHRVYVEQWLPGIVAWKAVHDLRRRRVIDKEALEFSLALGRVARQDHVADDALLDRLVRAELTERRGALDRHPALLAATEGLLVAVGRDLNGLVVSVAHGHGDFGYGNLLVDPRTGTLRGVIDWDFARTEELCGVDWCNYLIQSRRIVQGLTLVESVCLLAVDPGASAGAGGLGGESPRRAIVGLALLRFVLRSAQYPAVLARQESDLTEATSWMVAHWAEIVD